MKLRFWFQITVILHPSMSFLEIWIRGGIEMFRTSCKWRHKAIRRLDYPINQFLFGGHETKIKFFFVFFVFSSFSLLTHFYCTIRISLLVNNFRKGKNQFRRQLYSVEIYIYIFNSVTESIYYTRIIHIFISNSNFVLFLQYLFT